VNQTALNERKEGKHKPLTSHLSVAFKPGGSQHTTPPLEGGSFSRQAGQNHHDKEERIVQEKEMAKPKPPHLFRDR